MICYKKYGSKKSVFRTVWEPSEICARPAETDAALPCMVESSRQQAETAAVLTRSMM